MNTLIKLLLFLFLPLLIHANDIESIISDLAFKMPEIKEPRFSNLKISIDDFGAVSGGNVLNTKAFKDAFDFLSEKGGGVLIVPAGLWLTGPVVFRSNINLHLESGAVILFSDKIEDYSLIKSTWEGLEDVRHISPVFGRNLENIAITGTGIIDGSGDAWRPVQKSKMTQSQ